MNEKGTTLDKAIHLRVSSEGLRHYEEAARKFGLGFSDYCRTVLDISANKHLGLPEHRPLVGDR